MYSTQHMKMHILVQLFGPISHTKVTYTLTHAVPGTKIRIYSYKLTNVKRCPLVCNYCMAKNCFNTPVKVTFENDI